MFLVVNLLLLTSCANKVDIKIKEDPPPILIDINQLGFVYKDVIIREKHVLIDAFITNGYEENIYPTSLYLKVFNNDKIFAEDTLFFTDNYFIAGKSINKVTIMIPLIQNVVSIKQCEIYYEYTINEKPITQTV